MCTCTSGSITITHYLYFTIETFIEHPVIWQTQENAKKCTDTGHDVSDFLVTLGRVKHLFVKRKL